MFCSQLIHLSARVPIAVCHRVLCPWGSNFSHMIHSSLYVRTKLTLPLSLFCIVFTFVCVCVCLCVSRVLGRPLPSPWSSFPGSPACLAYPAGSGKAPLYFDLYAYFLAFSVQMSAHKKCTLLDTIHICFWYENIWRCIVQSIFSVDTFVVLPECQRIKKSVQTFFMFTFVPSFMFYA